MVSSSSYASSAAAGKPPPPTATSPLSSANTTTTSATTAVRKHHSASSSNLKAPIIQTTDDTFNRNHHHHHHAPQQHDNNNSYASQMPPPPPQPSYRNSLLMGSNSATSAFSPTTRSAAPTMASPLPSAQIRALLDPPPQSFPLRAALELLLAIDYQNNSSSNSVYLLDYHYLQNWLVWALHQPTAQTNPKAKNDANRKSMSPLHGNDNNNTTNSLNDEGLRQAQAIRWAALRLGMVPVPSVQTSTALDYRDPGPMDSSALAVEGHPLLLSPLVQVHNNNNHDHNNSDHHHSSSDQGQDLRRTIPLAQRRVRSFTTPDDDDDDDNHNNTNHGRGNRKLKPPPSTSSASHHHHHHPSNSPYKRCVAVPEGFYETLRAVHGVVCDDGVSVSFQKAEPERLLLLHNVYKNAAANATTTTTTFEEPPQPRPIEFRRKIIHRALAPPQSHRNPKDLMEKLVLEEQALNRPLEPVVETHPIKIIYHHQQQQHYGSTASNADDTHPAGFGLVSRDALAGDALAAIQRAAVPQMSMECVRIWSRRDYSYGNARPTNNATSPTAAAHGHNNNNNNNNNSGWELVDWGLLNHHSHRWTLQEWVELHEPLPHSSNNAAGEITQVHVLLETRPTGTSPWPRDGLALSERIRVGDVVDAQDVAGKWFEAVVRQVHDRTIVVHYAGWASKWDTTLKRYETDADVPGVGHPKLSAPAPLWSQTLRWRERLRVGDVVEVRDSSSLVERPKWYRGEVKQVGRPHDAARALEGCAQVEVYAAADNNDNDDDDTMDTDDDDKSKTKLPLLLLGRTQQVLVEVAQERTEKAGNNPGEGDLAAGLLEPDPPFLRWINLFGEEICALGTHLTLEHDAHTPALVTYDYESHRKPVEVLKSHHPSLGAGFMRESLRGVPPAPGSVGLHNLGNSCFLNSTIQCLNHIEPLSQFFLQDDRYMEDLNRKNPLGSGGNVAMSYGELLKKMWGGDYATLAPRFLKQTVAAFAPQFDNSYQHDSQEFCQFLMDGLHEDLNRVQTKPYVEELEGIGMEDSVAAIESWRKHLLRHDSIIVDHCQGMHRSHLTCPRCGRESIKFDIFSSLSVPVVSNKQRTAVTLYDCLDQFMEGEQLDERNAWYCPKCRQHVCALKMISLWTVPDVLVVHLKRFTFDTCMTSGNMLRAKVDDKVDFPIERLDLTKYVLGPVDPAAPPVYKLFGVSEHMGPTANSGHYTATVRNSVDGQWYRCNDSHVGRTSGEASITGGAYVLFYQRIKQTTKWGGMHKVMMDQGIDPYGGLNKDLDGFSKVVVKSKKKRNK